MTRPGNFQTAVLRGVLAAGTAVCALALCSAHVYAKVGVTAAVNGLR